jgi:hypothetical protein
MRWRASHPASRLIMHVKIVLRDRESGHYYRGPLEWVRNPYDALTFPNILEAEEFCRANSLLHLQLIQQSGYFQRPLRHQRKYSGIVSSSNRSRTVS